MHTKQGCALLGILAAMYNQASTGCLALSQKEQQCNAHLQALLDLSRQPHTGPRVGSQVDDGQLVLQRMLSGSPEHSVLARPKGPRVVRDVVGNRNDLQKVKYGVALSKQTCGMCSFEETEVSRLPEPSAEGNLETVQGEG